jgi:hypothetical protein
VAIAGQSAVHLRRDAAGLQRLPAARIEEE